MTPAGEGSSPLLATLEPVLRGGVELVPWRPTLSRLWGADAGPHVSLDLCDKGVPSGDPVEEGDCSLAPVHSLPVSDVELL